MILEATLAPDTDTAAVVETPEPSLREQLETASTEIRTRDRDEQGRFAAKARDENTGTVGDAKPADASTTPAASGTVKPAEATAAAATTPETLERPTLAPNAWSHQAKAAFANADPAIKAEIAKREADIHREFTKQDGERNFGRAMKQAIDPYMPLIQAEGGNPATAIQNFLETTRILRQGAPAQKAQLVRAMCQQFGVDLGPVSGESTGAQPAIAPEIQRLHNQIAELQTKVQGFGTYAESQALAPLQAQIEAFSTDPANVHFEAVKPEMVALLQGGRAQSLKDAYDMAVWARPDIRSSLISKQHAETEAKRVADARAKADAARRAGGSVIGSPGLGASTDPKAGNRSIREELVAAGLTPARI